LWDKAIEHEQNIHHHSSGGIIMTTEAQIEANRSNAQKSTGPRTPEGKAVVAQNAITHGLLAREVVIKGEDPQEFALYRGGMLGELAPVGQVESLLAQRIVGLSWRLRRAERLQGAAFETLAEEKEKWVWSKEDNEYVVLQSSRPGPCAEGSAEEARAAERRMVLDFGETRTFDRLLVYERRIEHSLYRSMAELRKVQTLRKNDYDSAPRTPFSTAESIAVWFTGVWPRSSIWAASRQTGWSWWF
jgi:hypothetical protein